MRLFNDLNLREFGNTVEISGCIYTNQENGEQYLIQFPGELGLSIGSMVTVHADTDDWKALLLQTDQMETEVLAKAKDGTLTKAIIRKCTRQIEQGISWKVYRRDNYACRYCGADEVPLTVDHVVLWEDGGPSIEKNLITSCRKCNKTRSNTPYADWLKSEKYLQASKGLTQDERDANEQVCSWIADIPVKLHVASR